MSPSLRIQPEQLNTSNRTSTIIDNNGNTTVQASMPATLDRGSLFNNVRHMTEQVLSPIALFVYNRPSHTRQTVEALKANALASESDLFIYSDAAPSAAAVHAVSMVRAYLKEVTGFKSITIIERDKNFGLANSIVDGVTALCERFGRLIVLEDDLVTSPHFLRYMNEALEKYAGEPNVYSISGYSFTNDASNVDSTYFLSITSSWGWATWNDKWKSFERNHDALAEALKSRKFRKRFNYENSYDYAGLASNQLTGKIDSWAIYWYFCVFQRGGLTLYPAKSLVQNIGFDGSGTHKDKTGNEASCSTFLPTIVKNSFESKKYKRIIQKKLRKSFIRRSLLSIMSSIVRKLFKIQS